MEKRKVLVVDDDHDIRDALRLILDSSGYETLGASSGREALSLLRRDGAIQLILLDMMMPEMDGWGFRRAQLESPQLAQIPVIVLTGDGRAREKADGLGAVDHLRKPLDVEELLERVARYSALPEAPAAPASIR